MGRPILEKAHHSFKFTLLDMMRREAGSEYSYITGWGSQLRVKGPAQSRLKLGQRQLGRAMELSVVLLLAVLTGLLLLLARGHPKAHGRLPPGPRPLAFLGNILQMDRRGLLKSFLRVRCRCMGSEGDLLPVDLGITPQKE